MDIFQILTKFPTFNTIKMLNYSKINDTVIPINWNFFLNAK